MILKLHQECGGECQKKMFMCVRGGGGSKKKKKGLANSSLFIRIKLLSPAHIQADGNKVLTNRGGSICYICYLVFFSKKYSF